MVKDMHQHRWTAHMRAQRLSARTIDERVRFIARVREAGEDPARWSHDEIAEFFARQGWQATTAASYWSHLRAWHKWLQAQDYRPDNPLDRLTPPRRPRSTPRPITTQQLARVLGSRMRRRTRAAILLAALAGMRVHEVAKFRGEDLDRDAATIRVTGKGGHAYLLPAHRLVLDHATRMPARYWVTRRGTLRARPLGPLSRGPCALPGSTHLRTA